MATRATRLKATGKRQAKAKRDLLKAFNRTTSEIQAQRIADAIHEHFFANLFHVLTYVSKE